MGIEEEYRKPMEVNSDKKRDSTESSFYFPTQKTKLDGSRARVYVIENDDTMRNSMVNSLAEAGYEVCGCVNMEDAERKLQLGEGPIFVFADLNLDDPQATDFIGHLRKHPEKANISIVLISVHNDMRLKAEKLGIGFVNKNYQMKERLISILEAPNSET